MTKGTKVFVSGRLQTREFANLSGEKIRRIEIVAPEVITLDKRKNNKAVSLENK